MIAKGKANLKERKRKALRFGAVKPKGDTIKGLKGESLALNPDLLEVQTPVQRNDIGAFTWG